MIQHPYSKSAIDAFNRDGLSWQDMLILGSVSRLPYGQRDWLQDLIASEQRRWLSDSELNATTSALLDRSFIQIASTQTERVARQFIAHYPLRVDIGPIDGFPVAGQVDLTVRGAETYRAACLRAWPDYEAQAFTLGRDEVSDQITTYYYIAGSIEALQSGIKDAMEGGFVFQSNIGSVVDTKRIREVDGWCNKWWEIFRKGYMIEWTQEELK